MRITLLALSLAVLGLCGCREHATPGQPLDNVTAMNTEDTGPWRVIQRTEQGGRIALRVAAEVPSRAERIARKAIDQNLDRSPSEIAVDVVPASAPSGTPVARVVWQRPPHTPTASMPPSAEDPRGSVSSDRQGSPERAVGREEQ